MTVVVIDGMKVHQMAHMLGSARAEALSYSEIIFEEFQPM